MSEQDDNLKAIAQQLIVTDKKVQLIYAFNGTGKTRLSRALKGLIAPKLEGDEEAGPTRHKILYYNAHTEDLFYWNNDPLNDSEHKLIIQPNSFTDWILVERGQDQNIIANFQRYTNDKLTPAFIADVQQITNQDGRRENRTTYPFVTFSHDRGTERSEAIKISKGEESVFIWSVFFTLLDEVVSVLEIAEPDDRPTDQYNQLEYVFIDDPVSSLDDNHLIELAQNIATLIAKSPQDGPKFVITTHNPLFYNVLHNAFKNGSKYRLSQNEDGSFDLEAQRTDSPFSYHLHLIEKLKFASEEGEFEKYHYNFLRNILEKTATFLGYENWSDLLPRTADGSNEAYYKRIIDISSHSKHSAHELTDLSSDDKRVLDFLLRETANKMYQFPERYRINLEQAEANG